MSRQTVTRAVNDMPGISPQTRERVLAAARELHYRPSRFGRGLVEQGPTTLGLLVDDLSNGYYAELGAAFVRAGSAQGWNVVIAETAHATDRARVPRELARRVDALVGYGVQGGVTGGVGMPVVHLDGDPVRLDEVGVVEFSAREAMTDLAAHLAAAGVRRPLVIEPGRGEPGVRARALSAALAGLHEEGRVEVRKLTDPAGHRELLASLVTSRPGHLPPDALIAFNDELAARLLRALRTLDVAVPETVRVVGFDGLELANLVWPALTTLALDLDLVARETVDLVAGMLTGEVPLQGPPAHRVLRYALQRGGSA